MLLQEKLYKFPESISRAVPRQYNYTGMGLILGYKRNDKHKMLHPYYVRGDYGNRLSFHTKRICVEEGSGGMLRVRSRVQDATRGRNVAGVGSDLTLSIDVDLQAYGGN